MSADPEHNICGTSVLGCYPVIAGEVTLGLVKDFFFKKLTRNFQK